MYEDGFSYKLGICFSFCSSVLEYGRGKDAFHLLTASRDHQYMRWHYVSAGALLPFRLRNLEAGIHDSAAKPRHFDEQCRDKFMP